MCALKCPLCAETNFPNIDALRTRLITAANGPLACPICHNLFLGLDKLTIHLFSHTVTNVTMNESTATTRAIDSFDTVKSSEKTTTNDENPLKSADVKSAEPKFETTIDTKNTTVEIKRLNKENKIKKTRQRVEDEVNNATTNTTYRTQTVVNETETAATVTAGPAATSVPNSNMEHLSVCDICELTFRNEQLRDMHFRLVHQNGTNSAGDLRTKAGQYLPSAEQEFKCHLCSKTFKMKGSLRVHLKVVHLMCLPHQNGNGAKISICDRIRLKETRVVGATAALNKNVVGKLLSTKMDNADIEVLPHQPLQPPAAPQVNGHMAQCSQTNQIVAQFPSNGYTLGNFTLLPASTVAATTNVTSANMLNLNSNGDLLHALDVGGVTAINSNANVHLLINTNQSALLNAQAPVAAVSALDCLIESEAATKQLIDAAKIWKCDECAKTFTTKYFLKKHKRLHTGEMPYTCEICARTFTFQQSYHKHLLYHSNEKPHVCPTCGRAFKELSTLHNHERIHSGEKPFKCEVCGKCFRQRVSFLVHTRIHTGIMPYKCDVCQKSFRYKVSQRTHKCQLAALSSPQQLDQGDAAAEKASCTAALRAPTAEEISESFIKEFLENTSVNISDAQHSPTSVEIAAISTAATSVDCNGNVDVDGALCTKAIDDIVIESCNKMGIDGSQNIHVPVSGGGGGGGGGGGNDDCDSTTEKLQNMRLYSPQLKVNMTESGVDGVDNIVFPQFLLDAVEGNIL